MMAIPDERALRRRPPQPRVAMGSLPLRLSRMVNHLSPNRSGDANTVRLCTWVEIRLVSDLDIPIANERVLLFRPDGAVCSVRTNQDGLARFERFPLVCLNAHPSDLDRPAVVLPDVLEEWTRQPCGDFRKDDGSRDDYRRTDGVAHFVPVGTPRFEIKLKQLAAEEKFQHFRCAHEDNNASWGDAGVDSGYDGDGHWSWRYGSQCNQHVNFFLGYWFNYNAQFTPRGSETAMRCLPAYTSESHRFYVKKAKKWVTHRGYQEFLEPVSMESSEPVDLSNIPPPAKQDDAAYCFEYIRISKYVSRDGVPNAAGLALLEKLGAFNVYSVWDVVRKQWKKASKQLKHWLRSRCRKEMKGRVKTGEPEEQAKTKREVGQRMLEISRMTAEEAWQELWKADCAGRLDEEDEEDGKLMRKLDQLRMRNLDHHCGILLKRPRSTEGAQGEETALMTFSADQSKDFKNRIVMKGFGEELGRRGWLHVAIWRLKDLRPGGFAPLEAKNNAGAVSVHSPPRFVDFVRKTEVSRK